MTSKEKISQAAMAAACIHLAFLQPYVVLAPGERTNVFSGLVCLAALAVVVVCRKPGALKLWAPAVIISLALAALGGLSAAFSLTPWPSFLRVTVLLASGLGGFWCARLVLDSPGSQARFLWLCLGLLTAMVVLALAGHRVGGVNKIEYFLNSASHPLTNTIMLLSFAPLALLDRQSRSLKAYGAALLILGYAALCLSERVSVVFIPVGVALAAGLAGALRLRHLALMLLGLLLVAGYFSSQILWFKLSKQYPDYRLESYPFSWFIATEHPWWGIGLRAPRDKFLPAYQVKYPYTDKERFATMLKDIVSSDNILLTFLAGLGFPFTIIYIGAVLALLAHLARLAYRPPPGAVLPPLVLLLPLVMAMVQYQLFDGLLFPQNCWFFHVLLGLIPTGERQA
jgi:hypothetical protein